MDRETGINVIEKRRLRNVIDEQVKRFLATGGRITVLENNPDAPVKAVHGGGWNPASDFATHAGD
jgi:hypothetical protein